MAKETKYGLMVVSLQGEALSQIYVLSLLLINTLCYRLFPSFSLYCFHCFAFHGISLSKCPFPFSKYFSPLSSSISNILNYNSPSFLNHTKTMSSLAALFSLFHRHRTNSTITLSFLNHTGTISSFHWISSCFSISLRQSIYMCYMSYMSNPHNNTETLLLH